MKKLLLLLAALTTIFAASPTGPGTFVLKRTTYGAPVDLMYFDSVWHVGTGLRRSGDTISLNYSGVLPGVYGDATHVPQITVDSFGRATNITNVTISGSGGGGGGTVTSVGLALPSSVFTVSGSPVVGSGTLTGSFTNQLPNTAFMGPVSTTGPPTFRAFLPGDISFLTDSITAARVYALNRIHDTAQVLRQRIADSTAASRAYTLARISDSLRVERTFDTTTARLVARDTAIKLRTQIHDTADTLRKSIATKPVKHRFSISSTTGVPPITLSYNNTTRVLTLTPTGAAFSWWWYGIEHIQTGPLVLPAHSATTGLYFAWFDSLGVVNIGTAPFDLLRGVPIAIFDRNSTLAQTWVYPELHTDQITPLDHLARHTAVGALLVPGGAAISGYTLNSDLLASVTYGIGSATLWDEDAKHSITALADGGPYQVRYRTSPGVWSWAGSLTTPYRVGTTYITADLAGVQTELNGAALGQYVNYYVVLVPNLNGPQVVMFQGQAIHSTEAAATAETWQSIDKTGLPAVEFVPVWQITYRARSTYTGVTGRVQMVRAAPVGSTSAAGSAAATTLQAAYNASPTPQIVTSVAAGPLTVQRGTASDTNAVFQVQNGAGAVTARINADGTYTGNALTASKLATSRSIRMHGDGEWIVNFDGSANVDSTFALASTGVTGGTYGSATQSAVVTFDNKGRANSASNVTITPAWASVAGKPTAFAPATHATTHHSGGSDQITGQSLAGLTTSSSPQFAAALLSGTSPNLDVYVTGAPTTERRWRWSAYNDGTFGLSAQDDAGTGGGWAIQFDRTGTTPAGATIYGGLTLNGLPSGVVRSTGGILSASALTYADLTGTVPTWNQSTTGNAATSTKWATARTLAMSGDVSWTSASFDGSSSPAATTATLATVNANVGTFGSASTVAVPTVNGKGLITGITTATITPAAIGAQAAGTYLAPSNVSGAAGQVAAFSGTNTVAGDAGFIRTQTSGKTTSIAVGDGTSAVGMDVYVNGAADKYKSLTFQTVGQRNWEFYSAATSHELIIAAYNLNTFIDQPFRIANASGGTIALGGGGRPVNLTSGSKLQINGVDAITSARAGDLTTLTTRSLSTTPASNTSVVGYNQISFNRGGTVKFSFGADPTIGGLVWNDGTGSLAMGINATTNAIKLPNLAGTGTRMVTAAADGTLAPTTWAYDGPWLPLTAGTGTPLTGIVPISEGWPRLRLQETGVAANTGNWQMSADGGVFTLDALNDALNGYSPVFTASRSGASPSEMRVYPTIKLSGGITGVIDGSSAGTGKVGEPIAATRSRATRTALSSSATTAVASITLTPGSYDVYAVGNTDNTTGWFSVTIGTTATDPQDGNECRIAPSSFSADGGCSPLPGLFNVSSNTTVSVYMTMYNVTSASGWGSIRAIRRR